MKLLYAAILASGLVANPSLIHAQQQTEDIGGHEYFVSCAGCHGDKGKGDGPFSVWLKKPAADLTKIQKENAGVFPFDRIYQVIDGRIEVAAHGPRDMPIWGETYKREAIGLWGILLTPYRVDSFVRGRILALVGYVYTLQAK
jgi:mono/diheme cytochrome c family protein